MASNRGLTNQEILDKLFADDQKKDAVPNIGVDAQSDAEEAETEYEVNIVSGMACTLNVTQNHPDLT